MLPVIVSDVAADPLHEFRALASHIQTLFPGYLKQYAYDRYYTREFWKCNSSAANFRSVYYLDACKRQLMHKDYLIECQKASAIVRRCLNRKYIL